jgi:hypothetical protein
VIEMPLTLSSASPPQKSLARAASSFDRTRVLPEFLDLKNI